MPFYTVEISIRSFFDKIDTALKQSLPFVGYRLPQENEIKSFFQKDASLYTPVTYEESGFVFAPFNDVESAVLFPLEASNAYTASTLGIVTKTSEEKKIEASLSSKNDELRHINLVRKGIDFLKATGVKKVVLSRKKKVACHNFKVINAFKKLLEKYTNAQVYIWFHPKVGLWMGATPETLLKVTNTTFTTMALAGTQVYNGSLDVVWQDKEKQEQQFVTDFIVKKLKKEVTVSKPTTIKAGSLLHLCTTISGKLSQKLNLHKLLKLLHPTPAVCGLPQEAAKNFILENEGYNRKFYTGFLGEIHINNVSNLFVNLRCMQVFTNELAIYVGGGITIDSIPKNEWEETVAKSAILLEVLDKF